MVDVAYIQAQGLYNFFENEGSDSRVEILDKAEIRTILASEICVSSSSAYEAFKEQFAQNMLATEQPQKARSSKA